MLALVKPTDIIYSNTEVNVSRVVYYVVKDEKSKSLVIAIRGTLSFEDCLTCSNAKPVYLTDIGLPDSYSHSGIVDAALDIANTLKSKAILLSFLQKHPDYRIITCGHSLGAGTASVLAIILKQNFENTYCFAYGCPPIFDRKLAKKASSFIVSVAYSYDIICRLSMQSLYSLKENMKWCFKNINSNDIASKWEHLTGVYAYEEVSNHFKHLSRDQILSAQSDYSLKNENNDCVIPVDSDKPMPESLPFYPPGRLYYILPVKNEETVVFRASIDSFNEILVSFDMLKDHYPYIYSVFIFMWA